jgi:hypothetical protein
MQVTINSDQSLIDITLQTKGSIDDLFSVIDELGADSVHADVSEKTIVYEPKNFVQLYYFTRKISVANKPTYANTFNGAILADSGYLLQSNNYKILI